MALSCCVITMKAALTVCSYTTYRDGKGKSVNYSGNHKRSLKMSLRDSLKKLRTGTPPS